MVVGDNNCLLMITMNEEEENDGAPPGWSL
jgi:hypothetical protein